jgi:hypothetical protein
MFHCRCGVDFRKVPADPAPRDLLAIQALIYQASGITLTEQAQEDLRAVYLPPELERLELGSLLRIVVFAGSIGDEGSLRPKQRPFGATDLTGAKEIAREAAALFGEWPRPFHEVLRRMLPAAAKDPSKLNFSRIYGNFYRHLFRVLSAGEAAFLRQEFERFVVADWKGLIRGNHRYFSPSVHTQSHWACAHDAEKLARTTSSRIMDLVRAGQIDGLFVKVSTRTECWVKRESLSRWIARRDSELARFMLRPEAEQILGIKNITATSIAEAGAIRHVHGPTCDFPIGVTYFLREDVMRIRDAFERCAAPVCDYVKPGSLIALRHAVKNFLGRGPGLASVIRAVVDGALAPVGRTPQFRGIMGYLFRLDDLRAYRPVSERAPCKETFLNFREAASVLKVKSVVIRALVQNGVFTVAPGYKNGFAKLIAESEVRAFAARFRAARRGDIREAAVETAGPKLAQSDVLRVQIPEVGRGFATFVPRQS